MDGTAAGILGKIPDFRGWTVVVSAPNSLLQWQYLMPSSKLRALVSKILERANFKGQDDRFSVPLQEFSHTARGLLLKPILGGKDLCEADLTLSTTARSTKITAETGNEFESIRAGKRKPDGWIIVNDLRAIDTKCVRDMLLSLFALEPTGDESDSVSLRNETEDLQLRGLVIDFCRCFLTDTILGGVLRTKSSV